MHGQSLAIKSQLGNKAGEAISLGELGNLYAAWGRLEQAIVFYRQAADIHVQHGDKRYEGQDRNNIAGSLIKLQRYKEARSELQRAIDGRKEFGHSGNLVGNLEYIIRFRDRLQ
ncbi:MAG: tetratricopeptide repeat protein [Methylococcales bacterium]|nr:tetratricopeptide repeat protein [Methylococcales bacterium]